MAADPKQIEDDIAADNRKRVAEVQAEAERQAAAERREQQALRAERNRVVGRAIAHQEYRGPVRRAK
ncbi:MAG TPA: hypothetical protein VGQ83_26740 [Polyangia bacterium]|jgi:hypothetical protein